MAEGMAVMEEIMALLRARNELETMEGPRNCLRGLHVYLVTDSCSPWLRDNF